MREVKVFKYEKKEGDKLYSKVENGSGKFHAWGVDFEELGEGAGNFSTAIIEREDGTIENVPVHMIQFNR